MKATEKTKAAYAMLRFGGDNAMLGGVNVRGNIGVRIVRTDIDSTGSVGFPQPNVFTQLLLTPCGTPLGPDAVVNPACYLTDDLIAFADGSGTPNNFKASYTNVLPSLNVRFGLDDHNFVRFGYSRSEEHTSELQSLMRTSYAVFCLKKKNNNTRPRETT